MAYYQVRENTNNYNKYRDEMIQSIIVGSFRIVGSIIGLGLIGIVLYYSALIVSTSFVSLTLASINTIISTALGTVNVSSSFIPHFWSNCFIVSISGAAAGIIVGLLRNFKIFKNNHSETIINSLFSHDLVFKLPNFWGLILLNALIGLIIGFICGASGAVSLVHVILNVISEIILNSNYPLYKIMVVGGFGGIGLGDDFLALFFIFLIIIVSSIIIGILSGLIISIFQGLIYGAIHSISSSIFKSFFIVQYEIGNYSNFFKILIKSMKEGLISGLTVGIIVGIIQATSTLFIKLTT